MDAGRPVSCCWLETSVPHDLGLSMAFLRIFMIWQLPSLRTSDPRENVHASDQHKLRCFHDLVLEVRNHHFCCMLLVTQTNFSKLQEGPTQGCDYPQLENPVWGPTWRLAITGKYATALICQSFSYLSIGYTVVSIRTSLNKAPIHHHGSQDTLHRHWKFNTLIQLL